ncbi:MAG: hypothetical protein HC836_45240 [Richelia sp. RM2_1_2]|nr:hypothetical protein [Richelia sp. RM2_1_2]
MIADWIKIHLPRPGHIGRFVLWGTGRVLFSSCLFCIDATSHTLSTVNVLLRWTRQSIVNLVRVYDQLPYMGVYGQNIIDVSAVTVDLPEDIITDIVDAISGKQLMIIGEMGSGKSTVAQYLAYAIGGQVKVYECEGTPTDWQGLEVIGKGEDWESINEAMGGDLEDLTNQMQLRLESGDNALAGTERVIICEEYPELVRKVEVSGEWLERHARRGRKAKRFTILLSQYDRVAAWGLEGKADLQDAFWKLRLGKKAVSHAKQLKNDVLVKWLQEDKSHCLLNEQACKLPSYREMKVVTQRLHTSPVVNNVVTAETTAQQDLQAEKLGVTFNPEGVDMDISVVSKSVRALVDSGMSDTAIIKDILGYQGSRFRQGKELLERIKNGGI